MCPSRARWRIIERLGEVELGTRLGDRYRLTEVAGVGGMAIVYKAVDEQSGDIVAVKMLRSDVNHARADERLVQEAALGARLDHVNCVSVIDSGAIEGAPFLVMQFASGQLLRDYLAEVGALPWRAALEIAAHLLRGLAHAHGCGVLHRDIKPENVVIAPRGDDPRFARLIDFGISKVLGGADPNLTGTGIIIGTPRYLAPEQAVGGTIGPATDLYAVTCVLFELLTGQPPFDGSDLVQIVTAHAMTPAPDPRELRPDLSIPEGVATLVSTGLRKRTDERFPSAAAYLAEIERLLERPEVATTQLAVAPLAKPADVPGPADESSSQSAASFEEAAPPLDARAGSGSSQSETEVPRTAAPLRRYGKVIAATSAIACAIALVVVTRSERPAQTRPPHQAPLVLAATPPDPELLLKANLHDLVNGSTCAERLAAVEALRRLGDKRAVPALKRARTRIRGGFLGLGGQNTNQCLRAAVDAAIRELDPPPPSLSGSAVRPSRSRK